MDEFERWRGLFAHPERLERWQASARRAEQQVGAFLQFAPELALADTAGSGRQASVTAMRRHRTMLRQFIRNLM